MRCSTTSVLVVLAPVMPSLKPPVILELASRMRRLPMTSFRWKKAEISATKGMMMTTQNASWAFRQNMEITQPMT